MGGHPGQLYGIFVPDVDSEGAYFPWTSQTLTLTADNTTDLLSFIAIGSGGVPPQIFLDGVDMETSVPEPSALMLLAGVGAVISIGRIGRRVRANRTGIAA